MFSGTFILFVTFRGIPAPTSLGLGDVVGAVKDLSTSSGDSDQGISQHGDDTEQRLDLPVDSDVPSQTQQLEAEATSTSTSASTTILETTTTSSAAESTSTFSFDPVPYVDAIMRPEETAFPRLECPVPKYSRYDHLRANTSESSEEIKREFFFALDLYKCVDLLPRLMGSILEAMRFLGPERCALSIVEGRSGDGTYEVLEALGQKVTSLGGKFYLQKSDVNPKGEGQDRILLLAELRNLALKPIVDDRQDYSQEAMIMFINDVAICSEDILELIYQREYQEADMVCAMDWTFVGPTPSFYDVWVARSLTGDLFFDIPASGSWDYAYNLFWDDPESQLRYKTGKSLQVFSCWNGATIFPAKPVMAEKIKFRRSYDDECYQGEPQIFCKELWKLGYGKLAVVPTVNVEYSDDAAKEIKKLKGYTSDWIAKEKPEDPSNKINWKGPPDQVKCMPEHTRKYWVPWDEESKTKKVTY